MTSPSEDRITKARIKVAQAQARLEAITARADQYERKADTRRKIIIGGLLIEAAKIDPRYGGILDYLVRHIVRESDRRPFVGWSPPTPPGSD